jgi:hypothetical protein
MVKGVASIASACSGGSQFTSAAFTGTLAATGVRISMDGRGRWMDNVFIERLWRSLKYEDIYLKGYSDGHEAKAGIARWIEFYNFQRPHQAPESRAPMAVWRAGVTGAFGEKAVDMMLLASEKLGQRCALPGTESVDATATSLEFFIWPVFPSTFKKGANSGGPPDFPGRPNRS